MRNKLLCCSRTVSSDHFHSSCPDHRRGQFETLAVQFGTVDCSGYPMICHAADTSQLCQARALQLIHSGKVPNL